MSNQNLSKDKKKKKVTKVYIFFFTHKLANETTGKKKEKYGI